MYGYKHNHNPARLIYFNATKPTLAYTEKAVPPRGRQNPGIGVFDDKYIIIAGGFHPDTREFFKHSDVYDIATDSFRPEGFIPNVNTTRYCHSLFQMGPNLLYMVAGMTERSGDAK